MNLEDYLHPVKIVYRTSPAWFNQKNIWPEVW